MGVLSGLEPNRVFHWFEEICRIPHGSGSTKAISDYLVRFARDRGLDVRQDELNNVIIRKPASSGYEAAPAVMLQGHMDMVCEKEPGCGKNMDAEGLDLVVDRDTVYAKGTTLGGDDGIAVAMILALLESKDLPHPLLEAVLTVDEETGMTGASAVDLSDLQSRLLINLDSEVEGVFTAGCAGGARAEISIPVKRQYFSGKCYRIVVSDLTGGHSGIEINRGRANANVLLGRVLYAVGQSAPMRIITVNGGSKDNAIPVSAEAVISVESGRNVAAACREMESLLRREYSVADGTVSVSMQPCDSAQLPMDAASASRIMCLLQCAPNGVQEMSREVEGLVQTSLNLGILATYGEEVRATFCVRSNINSQKEMLLHRLELLCGALGGTFLVSGTYPAWEYRADSPLRRLMVEVFAEQYGHTPTVEVIHAGVECGLLADKLPGLDCVSIGPDLTEIHTPRERMHVASVRRTWALLTETLRRIR